MKAVVSEKGQVTIPKRLRASLGIRPGQVLDFQEDRGRLIATKAVAGEAVDRAYGILEGSRTSDEIVESLRGAPDAV